MTSDKELLELAAKAAGYDVSYDEIDDVFYFDNEVMVSFFRWNPLTDDGDALRLAVKLQLDVSCCGDSAFAKADNQERYSDEYISNDPYAATRRAITRAAAEIGRSVK